MTNSLHLLAIIFAGISVGVADALIKKVSSSENIWMALKNPWMAIILLLYLAQIVFFIYVFTHGWKLGIAGNAQMIFYSLIIVLTGFFFFGESFSLTQGIGICLALVAIFLMNS